MVATAKSHATHRKFCQYLKDNKHSGPAPFGAKIARVFPWTLSVPRSSQFSSSFTLGELFASWNTLYSTFAALPVPSLVFLVT